MGSRLQSARRAGQVARRGGSLFRSHLTASKLFPRKRAREMCSILRYSVRLLAEDVADPAQFCNAGVGNLGHKYPSAWQKRTGAEGAYLPCIRCRRTPKRDAGHPQGTPLRSFPVGGRVSVPRGLSRGRV